MALQLRVVGPQAARLGEHYTRVFGIHGGQIGRAPDNDWILPDEDRYVSGYHASVALHRGRWVLTDRSSNGTFVNGAAKPLPTHSTYTLKDGDRLRIGDYDIVVRITPEADFPPMDSVPSSDDTGSGAFAVMTHGDIGAELDLPSLLADANPPPDDPDDTIPPLDEAAAGMLSTADVARLLSEADDEEFAAPAGTEAVPAAVPLRPAAAAPRAVDAPAAGLLPAVQLLLRSAGLDPALIAPEDHAQLLTVAGQLLREMTLGLSAALRAATDSPDSVNTTAIRNTSPLTAAAGVNESLARLLGKRSQRPNGAVETVREGFEALRRHEQALHQATITALDGYLALFAPQELAQQFDRVLERSLTPGVSPKGRYWDMYSELYRLLLQRTDSGLPHAYAERYNAAYQAARDAEESTQITNTRRLKVR